MKINNFILDEFFRTMNERQEIWYKRNISKLPREQWTEDKILAEYKFCNVYRELDRSSQWLIKNVIQNANIPTTDRLFQCFVYRLFNIPEVFENIKLPTLDSYHAISFTESIREYENYKPSTNKKAYAVNSWISKGTTQGIACAAIIVPSLRHEFYDIYDRINEQPRYIINAMKRVEGIGDFLSYEWYLDMCYFDKCYNTINWNRHDENKFCNAGPGCIQGIKFITDGTCKNNLDFIKELRDLSSYMMPKFKYIEYSKDKKQYVRSLKPNITLHQIEFWLCEFQKYWKIWLGQGKKRDKYQLRDLF